MGLVEGLEGQLKKSKEQRDATHAEKVGAETDNRTMKETLEMVTLQRPPVCYLSIKMAVA
ncbi:hypothetical protein T484DRAFT_1786787 [Baffinella frigidus]|nr:hypothetical protein T484DRAFT_1786787 [Cryptophyta sp. CCMP2293]